MTNFVLCQKKNYVLDPKLEILVVRKNFLLC